AQLLLRRAVRGAARHRVLRPGLQRRPPRLRHPARDAHRDVHELRGPGPPAQHPGHLQRGGDGAHPHRPPPAGRARRADGADDVPPPHGVQRVTPLSASMNAVALRLLLRTLVTSSEAAMALTPIALIPQVVRGGLMVPMTTNPLLQYPMLIMPARWGFQGTVA